MHHGFIRIATAIPELRVADCAFNAAKIVDLLQQAEQEEVQVACFPELCITGYTCADLFFQETLLADALKALDYLALHTLSSTAAAIVGLPVRAGSKLFNAAAVLQGGYVLGVVPKVNLPNNNEFYEKRWFASGASCREKELELAGSVVPFGRDLLFSDGKFTFGVEICEDLWSPVPPSSMQALNGAEIIFNLSASNELVGKHRYRRQLIEQQSARCYAGYAYASSGAGESSTDVVFTGNGLIAENGKIIASAERFSFAPQLTVADVDVERLRADRIRNTNFEAEKSAFAYRVIPLAQTPYKPATLKRTIERRPFVPPPTTRDESCREIFSIQVGGLSKRWTHTQVRHLVLGVSGGLDSTLALLVCVKACDKLGFDRKRVIGITMPGFGTTNRTYANAINLMKSLGVTTYDIPVREASLQHFKDIAHSPEVKDITYENTQARERTQVLMDMANKHSGLVVGTGDLSELALGWATYGGDHISMYAVNSGVPKTLVRYLVAWAAQQLDKASADILRDVLDTPVSPELLPASAEGTIAQKTEDIVGPYELHDFFLYYFVRFGFSPQKIAFLANHAFKDAYTADEISAWLNVFLHRFFAQQFKRSCMPDGPKVGSINLSPRGDWRMPSDAVGWKL
ncbi:MAG: NAD(+) synthase [Prevotellaceae bacterium]|jgi:NAD+ synthase (glutamine-hydrolysing)|nr:NAD(+) synthase [Prevotellaceae bacterium]